MTTHTVQRGDTLWAIARRYNTTINAIASANGIANPNLIYPGQVFRISGAAAQAPAAAARSHTVQRGDTLSAIAARYGSSVSAIARANGIANVNLIYPGQVFTIPGASGGDTYVPPANNGGGVKSSQGLANIARQVAMSMGGYNSQGLCATGVSRAIQQMYGYKVWGNGNQIDDNLPRDKWKQVNMSLEEALKIPGLVLTWESTASSLGRHPG